MLSSAAVEVLGRFYRFAHAIGASPFEVRVQQAPGTAIRLIRSTSTRKLCAWYALVAFSVAYTIFVGIRTLQGIYVLNTPPEYLIFSVFGFICWCTVAAFNTNTVRLEADVALFINQF